MRSFNVINVIGFTHHRLHVWVTILINYAIIIKSSECLITSTQFLYRLHENVPLHLESLGIMQEYLGDLPSNFSQILFTSSISCLVRFLLVESFIKSADFSFEPKKYEHHKTLTTEILELFKCLSNQASCGHQHACSAPLLFSLLHGSSDHSLDAIWVEGVQQVTDPGFVSVNPIALSWQVLEYSWPSLSIVQKIHDCEAFNLGYCWDLHCISLNVLLNALKCVNNALPL